MSDQHTEHRLLPQILSYLAQTLPQLPLSHESKRTRRTGLALARPEDAERRQATFSLISRIRTPAPAPHAARDVDSVRIRCPAAHPNRGTKARVDSDESGEQDEDVGYGTTAFTRRKAGDPFRHAKPALGSSMARRADASDPSCTSGGLYTASMLASSHNVLSPLTISLSCHHPVHHPVHGGHLLVKDISQILKMSIRNTPNQHYNTTIKRARFGVPVKY
ncbi:hypothetical protein C8R44DRAFT_740041 [Mycena epipterygia]|nr:hypothetical protein C8R44DRAFT_740041 [Mycena epipterygia]